MYKYITKMYKIYESNKIIILGGRHDQGVQPENQLNVQQGHVQRREVRNWQDGHNDNQRFQRRRQNYNEQDQMQMYDEDRNRVAQRHQGLQGPRQFDVHDNQRLQRRGQYNNGQDQIPIGEARNVVARRYEGGKYRIKRK